MKRLYERDLTRLIQEIEAFPSDEALWEIRGGVTNAAGNLVLHLEGNLREFIGRQLGGVPYQREREKEFSTRGLSRAELAARIAGVREIVPGVIERLSADELAQVYPQNVLGVDLTTHQFVVHLYGHLNWHLGQIDYLRRVMTGDGALKLQGL
ncbi:MAG: DinB family protein [Acidobacteria bacterium]|nr:DinB family protein [Acidobacteriota bacterium]